MTTLIESIELRPRETAALVGAGSMSSAILRMAAELREAGRTVVTTSTVFMPEVNPSSPFYFLVEPDLRKALEQLPTLLEAHGHVRLAFEYIRADKIKGVEPGWVPAIAALPEVDNLIVEADGARHRPLKAPNEKEPALPPGVDVLLVTAGLDVLGKPLNEENAHRPELVGALTGLVEGDPVTPRVVAQVLASPRGGLKNVPADARVWFLLTGWRPANDEQAREMAALLLGQAPQAEGAVLLAPGHSGGVELIKTR